MSTMTDEPDVKVLAEYIPMVRRLEFTGAVSGKPIHVVELRFHWPRPDPTRPDIVVPFTADTAKKIGTALIEYSLEEKFD